MTHTRLFLLTVCLLTGVVHAGAQSTEESWQEVYEQLMTPEEDADDEDGGDRIEEQMELLQELADHPLDLNRCTRYELEQLPFLSAQQVVDLCDYLDHYGPMRSLGELRMVASLDYQQIRLLPFFVYVDDIADREREDAFPTLEQLAQRSRHELTGALRVPFYDRKGDSEGGYLGYKYRHWLRYELSSSNRLRLGIIGSQDAGEPFFARGNRWGYDAYSYYLQLQRLGPIESLVVGKYKLSAGMGLVLGSSFRMGKVTALQSLGRQTSLLRPHASRSEADYFEGAAAKIRLSEAFSLTGFASHRAMDATLNKADGTAATLTTNGYHRTTAEMEKKRNTHQTATGLLLNFRYEGFHAGLTAVYTHLDRSLQPNRQILYRRHYPHGKDFLNAGVCYGYTHHRVAIGGETAADGHGHVATTNSVSVLATDRLQLLALQRFYSYRYATLHGHSFGESSRVQNESGLYLGATWSPLPHFRLMAYADYARFAWARYLVSQPSHSWDLLMQASWHHRRWNVIARSRAHLRQRDNADKTALDPYNDYRLRLSADYRHPAGWRVRTQADAVRSFFYSAEHGYMFSQQWAWQHRWWQLHLMAGYFNTDSYQSRIYVYERQLQREFAFPTFSGEGLRCALAARADVGSHLRLSAKLGCTKYFDRSTISSGWQQVNGSALTDLDLQLRWKW